MMFATIIELIRSNTHNLYEAASKNLPSKGTGLEFIKWLGTSPRVVKASSPILVRWIAPPLNWAKLNCDGAFKGNPGHSGGGGVLRDHNGDLILAYGNYYGISLSLCAEAKALLDGLIISDGKGITHLWVEVDSMILFNML